MFKLLCIFWLSITKILRYFYSIKWILKNAGKDAISSSKNLTSESSPNSRETTMAAQTLDPNCILDIERSARHLATSVDEMVENLSGVLHGKQIYSTETINLYWDKTRNEPTNLPNTYVSFQVSRTLLLIPLKPIETVYVKPVMQLMEILSQCTK